MTLDPSSCRKQENNAPSSPEREGPVTHFGFRTVSEQHKQELVDQVFTSVAHKYDVMNDVMSLGVHRLWKECLVDQLAPYPSWKILDIGGGTGDIAFRILSRVQAKDQTSTGPAITVCDINPAMLAVGQGRARAAHPNTASIQWINGNAEVLPFESGRFDACTIAFCLRNVTHIDRVLREARRILKPGGHFLCLEFSQLLMPGFDRLYDMYSFHMLPRLGKIIADDEDSYRYLAESIRRFPAQDVLARLMAHAGFDRVSYQNLSGGIAALHSAWRI